MKVFLDMTLLDSSHLTQLKEKFPSLHFVTEIEDAKDAKIIFGMPRLLNKETLDQMPDLVWAMVLTAGYDTLDLSYFRQRKLLLTHAKDVYSIQIAEDVFAKILHFNRHMNDYVIRKAEHLWQHTPVQYDLACSTVGILGTGSIGKAIAKRMKAFDAHVIGYRKSHALPDYFDQVYHDKEGLNHLLKESDYVIIALPLDSKTHHLIGKSEMALMKPTAMLINMARGDIIDQDALIEALEKRMIRAAALDVTTPEPLPKDHPLWSCDHLFITPHNSSSSPNMRRWLKDEISDTLMRYLEKKPMDNMVEL